MPPPTCAKIVVEPVPNVPISEVITLSHKTPGLAHLKMGLHVTEQALPSWQYALIDSGCTDNLVSLTALETLTDYDKIVISPTNAKTIKTANNDDCQVVHGKTTLHMSLLTDKNERITFLLSFYVVSGLIHQIFIGQPFLTNPCIKAETNQLFMIETPNNRLHQIEKLYLEPRVLEPSCRTKLKPQQRKTITTKSCQLASLLSDDVVATVSLHPDAAKQFPGLYMPDQTVFPNEIGQFNVTIFNTSDTACTLPSQPLFLLTPELKESIQHLQLVTPIPTAARNESGFPTLKALHRQHKTLDEISFNQFFFLPQYIPVNSAFVSSFHDHPLTETELHERAKELATKGSSQLSISEVVDPEDGLAGFDGELDSAPVPPKNDDALLQECPLDHLSDYQQKHVRSMLKRYLHAFQRHPLDIGCCKYVTARAPLATNAPPVLYAKYIPIPLKYKEAAQKLIDEYVAAGVFAPTVEECQFTSNIFVIPKKNKTFRLIIDGRILSNYCLQLPLALGHLDEIFADLADKPFVSTLDVSKAYDQLAVDEKTSQLLSFFGPDAKRYVYKRAGQGLKFSSYFLGQAMDIILFGLPSDQVKSYCDDIYVATAGTFEQHIDMLEEVIARFAQSGMKLSVAKLQILPKTLEFLGHIWSPNKLSIPEAKLSAYYNLKIPKSVLEVQFLINSLSYYRHFLPSFSEIVQPIKQLVNNVRAKKEKFAWTDLHQNAVDKLLKLLKIQNTIFLPRRDRPFYIRTDASDVAAAATVSQYDDNGILQLVAAVSRSFTSSERNCAPVHKEILSLLYTLTSLDYILRGATLKIFADAKAMIYVKMCAASSPYISRLAMQLSQHDFQLYHIEGRLNLEADALSRLHKVKDKIPQKGNSLLLKPMTKEETLLFLEYLTIPSNYPLSITEIRQLLTTEPLKSELTLKAKTRLASRTYYADKLKPNQVKSKPTKLPRFTRKHPLIRPHNNAPNANVYSNPVFVHSNFPHDPSHTNLATSQSCISHSLLTNSTNVKARKSKKMRPRPDSPAPLLRRSTRLAIKKSFNNENISADSEKNSSPARASHTPQPSAASTRPKKVESKHPVTKLETKSDPEFLPAKEVAPSPLCSTKNNTSSSQLNPPSFVNKNISSGSSDPTVTEHSMATSEPQPSLLLFKSRLLPGGQISKEDLRLAQALDLNLTQAVIKYNLSFQNGLAGRQIDHKFRPYITSSMLDIVARMLHFHALEGHKTAKQIITLLQDQFFNPHIVAKVKLLCDQCFQCSKAKVFKDRKHIFSERYSPSRPRQIVAFDIIGGLPPSGHQNSKYIYLFVDCFSLYIHAIPAQTKSTEELLQAFLDLFALMAAVPEIIISDNETALKHERFQTFFKTFNIDHKFGPPHSPWTNPAEISVNKLKETIRTTIAQLNVAWPEALPLALISLNNTPVLGTSLSPADIHFSLNTTSKLTTATDSPAPTIDSYLELAKSTALQTFDRIKLARERHNASNRNSANRSKTIKSFIKGQYVWLKALNIASSRATQPKNEGPFVITEVFGHSVFGLASPEAPNTQIRTAHASHLHLAVV